MKNPKLESIRQRTSPEIRRMIDHSFGVTDRIELLMKKHNMTGRELAQRLGKNEAEVSRWMRGSHNFTLREITMLEIALGEPIFDTPVGEPAVLSRKSKAKE